VPPADVPAERPPLPPCPVAQQVGGDLEKIGLARSHLRAAVPGHSDERLLRQIFRFFVRADEPVRDVEHLSPIGADDGVPRGLIALGRTVLTFRDLRSLAETRHQALTDELTGLPNRRLFDRRLRESHALACVTGASNFTTIRSPETRTS